MRRLCKKNNPEDPFRKTLDDYRSFVELLDKAPRTVNCYVAHLRLFAEHFQSDPTQLNEEHLREYFLFLRKEKNYAPGTMNQAKVSLRTFYHRHLKIDPVWDIFTDIKIKHRETLPVVIPPEDVAQLLAAVTEPRFHTVLSLIYACGLRLSEALSLEVRDIDAKARRLHLRETKGGKDRFVPITEDMIQMLRQWWRWHRHPRFIFPGVGRRWKRSKRGKQLSQEAAQRDAMHTAVAPMSTSTVQNALKWAVAATGQRKRVTPHTLRHCYATHLLDRGISLRHISAYLGHASLNQTLVYVHLTSIGEEQTQDILKEIHREVISPEEKDAPEDQPEDQPDS